MKQVLIALSVLALVSCRDHRCLQCEENAFYKGLEPYLTWSGDWTNIYHNVYFFQKDTKNYFTIWIDYYYPSLWINGSENYRDLYNDRYIKIGEVDMLLIASINDSLPMGLLGDCKRHLKKRDSIPKYPDTTNDGSSYAMTFKYELIDGKYKVEQVEMDIDFFDSLMRGYEYYQREEGHFPKVYFSVD